MTCTPCEIQILAAQQLDDISHLLTEAANAKKSAAKLLETAKRAVEIAIEEDEPAALAFLDRLEGTS